MSTPSPKLQAPSPPPLIESVSAGGAMTGEQIARALGGNGDNVLVKACVSLLEHAMGNCSLLAESERGVVRDEACGARAELRKVRQRILDAVRAGKQ